MPSGNFKTESSSVFKYTVYGLRQRGCWKLKIGSYTVDKKLIEASSDTGRGGGREKEREI